MELSISNLTVRSVYKMPNTTRIHFTSYVNNVWRYHYCADYTGGVWENFVSWPVFSNCLSKDKCNDKFFLTEKTAVKLAASVRQRPNSEQQIFHLDARNYNIKKLILLREIAKQYLSSDILTVLFDMTK
jgi:hypothetical protein